MRDRRISYTKAKLQGDGIRIHPTSKEDYQKLCRTLEELQAEYYRGQLPEERTLQVVMKGLPEETKAIDIANNLKDEGYHPSRVTKMTSRKTKKLLPMFMIQLPQEEDRIFRTTNCLGLAVRIESHQRIQEATQCYNCQGFHHGQRTCYQSPRCVKCSGKHASRDCHKSNDQEATCANCGGPHPASYRGCPSCPAPPPARRTAPTTPPPRQGGEARSPPAPTPAPRRRPPMTKTYTTATAGPQQTSRDPPKPH